MPKVIINSDRCKACQLCVSVCPKKILELSKDTFNNKGYTPVRVTNMDECIGCAMCATICPDSVLTIEKEG